MAKVPIHEVRRIVLPVETAVDAVLELDREHGGRLSLATLISARIESVPEPGLSVELRRPGSLTTETRRFSLSAIAAAFINYCWKSRIPLPRHGTKRIDIVPAGFVPEGFAITIEGTVEVVRRHGALPRTAGMAAAESADVEGSGSLGHAALQDGAPESLLPPGIDRAASA